MEIRAREPTDEDAVRDFLQARNSIRVARLGVVLDPMRHPALVACDDGALVGVLTYVVEGGRCEILTLHAGERRRGAGSALLRAFEEIAAQRGCARLWVITTNDNVDALRFYQRRGFRLVALHTGAVDYSRASLKSEIPEVGDHGIALRDEIELEKHIDPVSSPRDESPPSESSP